MTFRLRQKTGTFSAKLFLILRCPLFGLDKQEVIIYLNYVKVNVFN